MQTALPAPPTFFSRLFSARQRPAVTRLFAERVRHGATRAFPPVRGRMTLHCRDGEAWITHDGDPKDVFLQPQQSYTVERGERMTLFAMKGDCVLEIQLDE